MIAKYRYKADSRAEGAGEGAAGVGAGVGGGGGEAAGADEAAAEAPLEGAVKFAKAPTLPTSSTTTKIGSPTCGNTKGAGGGGQLE